jgi:cell division protein FtsW
VSTASLTYAGFFFVLYLAAHLATRYAVPFADPYLLPIAGLLTAIGLTEIYRLNPTDAFRQGIWIVVAVALFAATLFFLRHDYRRLESYKYLFGDRVAPAADPAPARPHRERRTPLGARRLAALPAG